MNFSYRFDIEYEGKKYKEILNWNLNEPYLTPDSFAKLLAEENNLPTMIEHEIAFTIKR
jgi:hypothetical protein